MMQNRMVRVIKNPIRCAMSIFGGTYLGITTSIICGGPFGLIFGLLGYAFGAYADYPGDSLINRSSRKHCTSSEQSGQFQLKVKVYFL